MRSVLLAAAVVAVAASSAHAQAKKKKPAAVVFERFQQLLVSPTDDIKRARFAFGVHSPHLDPQPGDGVSDFEMGVWGDKVTVGFSANGEAAWLAADLAWAEVCGDESCPRVPKADGYYHATALLEGGVPWQPVMWHASSLYTGKEYAQHVKDGADLTAVPRGVKNADEVVTQLEATLGDPKALAKTVSPRADVVLYGTDRKERFLGGKKVAAQLVKWSLAFKVKDGVQAGTTASGTVAWVAANVDATSTKKPGAASPYRLTAIYEKTDAGWQIVNLHFSFTP